MEQTTQEWTSKNLHIILAAGFEVLVCAAAVMMFAIGDKTPGLFTFVIGTIMCSIILLNDRRKG